MEGRNSSSAVMSKQPVLQSVQATTTTEVEKEKSVALPFQIRSII
jgi:hypothetical protein